MNHYIHLESSFHENLANVHSRCSLSSPFIIHEGLKFLVKLIHISYIFKLVKYLHWQGINKLVKYLHWQGINKSTFESFRTSFPTHSKISQLECLFTILNDELPV